MTTTTPFTLTVVGSYPHPHGPSISATAAVEIPRTPREQAPKAMSLLTRDAGKVSRTTLRTHAGRLYTAYTPNGHGVEPGTAEFPAEIRQSYTTAPGWDPHAEPAAQHEVFARQDSSLLRIIDSYLWVEIGEPRYVAHHTPGVEDTEVGGLMFTVAMEDSEDLPPESIFRADEFDQAWEHALSKAHSAGDGTAVRYLHQHRKDLNVIEVHRAEAVTLIVPARPPATVATLQQDYAQALMVLAQTGDAEEEAQAWAQASAARSQIVEAGFTPLPAEARPVEGRDQTDSPSR